MNILITGATGLTGQAVTKHLMLLSEEHRIFFAVRRPALARQDLPAKTWQIRQFDFEDPFSYKPALEKIDRVFLLRPPQLANVKTYIEPFLKTAESAGVKHIVFLSIQAAPSNPWTPHYKIEQAIKKTGLGFSFLRPGYFMQNLTSDLLPDIKKKDEIFVPAGTRRFSFVDAEEVGEVAAKLLLMDELPSEAYTLVSSSPTDFYRVASLLSEVAGRSIEYRNPSLLWFAIQRKIRGDAIVFILVMIMLYRFTRIPPREQYAHSLQRLLHRPPKPLSLFLEEQADTFEPEVEGSTK